MSSLCDRYGPWALVAGASEGIGAAFAEALAAAGFNLVLIARLRGVLEAFDVGLLVYNAALSIVAPFLDTSLSDKQRMLDVNARGPLIAAHVCGQHFAARGRGGIVLLSSLTAFWGSAWVATYGATKAFNLGLGEALALELAPRNVDVVVSCVGATRTPGFVQLMAGRKAPRSMSPAEVACETLAALPKRGAFIPGRWNRLAQQLLVRVLPRRAAVEIMASQTKPLL